MKKILFIFLILLLSLSLFACEKEKDEEERGCDINENCNDEKADMSEYETYIDSNEYVYVKSNVKEMYEKVNNKETFVIYFGFARCPWCRDIMPILDEASKKSNNEIVYYVNTREKEEWKSNLDIDDYDLFVEMAFDYLRYDDNNIKHLYTPMVFFIKNGEIVKTVSAPDYDAHDEKIPDNIREELLNTLLDGFNSLK